MPPRPPVFVLDQDFPDPAGEALPGLIPELQLLPLRRVHPDLVEGHDDWEVLKELKVRGGVDGLITLDAGMLSLAKEMVDLHQTRLSLVVLTKVDNDPIVAWGLLLIHGPSIAHAHSRSRPQLWVIRKPGSAPPQNPKGRIAEIARRENVPEDGLYREHRLLFANLRRSASR